MCCPVGSLPADTEMKAAAGMPVSITGINFTEIRATYLIGSPDSVPAFKCTDTTAGSGTKNACEVTIELDSFCSWVNVGDVLPTYVDGGYVAFQDWRQVADATYAQKNHTHVAPEVTDEDYNGGMTQDQINQDLADLAAAGIVL